MNKSKICYFLTKCEDVIEHFLFMFSPMPTYDGFTESLQEGLIRHYWVCKNLQEFSRYLSRHYSPNIRILLNKTSPLFKKLCPNYVPMYWETTKIDVARTVARMCANGGIRRMW